jgi:ribonucleotide reductase alpha subunit
MSHTMYVVKRDGTKEEVDFGKCQKRIEKLAHEIKPVLRVNSTGIGQQIIIQISDGIKTSELDELAASICANKESVHPDYGRLATRIIISNHHKNTSPSFSEVIQTLWNHNDSRGLHAPLVAQYFYDLVMKNKEKLNTVLDYNKDYNYSYFGFKTLERAYLMRVHGKIVERPQHMLMRVSLAIHRDDIREAIKCYKMLADGLMTHATPTLFNMGTPREQASSCFLVNIADDSIAGIYKTLSDCAKISQFAGGLGVSIHKIRAKDSFIYGTNGKSNGIVPMLRNFNETARYVDQCFTPDTLIYTLDGIKSIANVTIGDKVLTSEGVYHNVNLPVRHYYSGKLLSFRVSDNCFDVKVTPEHQIMSIRKGNLTDGVESLRRNINLGLVTLDFYDAKDLEVGDFLVTSIPDYEIDISQITEDDCRMYGIIVSSNNRSVNKISLYIDKTKKETIDFIVKYLSTHGITYTINDKCLELQTHITWSNSTPGFKFTMSQFIQNGESIIDSKYVHLPLFKIINIIQGFIEYSNPTMINITEKLEESLRINTPSQDVSKKLSNMLLRCGISASICISNIIIHASTISIQHNHKTIILTPIKSIDNSDYNGVVHDFEIDKPHDYTVFGFGVAHNGGGKRNGSIAMYLEPWHADIIDFLMLKRNTGIESERCRDLFFALWVSDLFMRRVEADEEWTLMCPNVCRGLQDCYGDAFDALYTKYEREGLGVKKVRAREIWNIILDSQVETGMPYICYKDAVNKKNNQENLGVIQSSNLCAEIVEFTSPDEIAVCNLASLALPKMIDEVTVKDETTGVETSTFVFDFKRLEEVTKMAVKNLNKIIDCNYYPVPEAERSNRRHRPIGVGVQGLADVFAIMKMPFESVEAAKLNKEIFAHMYIASMEASMDIARKRKKYVQEYRKLLSQKEKEGNLSDEDNIKLEELKKENCIIDEELKLPSLLAGAYSSFVGSPASNGRLQYDLWGVEPSAELLPRFEKLKDDIKKHGLRNSLCIAIMPTASTSQILGNNECCEPYTSNIYKRRTLAGEFKIVNPHLMAALIDLGIWNQDLKDKIIVSGGSVQNIPEIPDDVKVLYKTVWEISQKSIIDMAADRGAYICQTQSMNLFMTQPTYKKLTSMHFYSWKKGLKTGIYYLRSQAVAQAQQFSIDASKLLNGNVGASTSANLNEDSIASCSTQSNGECLMCSA